MRCVYLTASILLLVVALACCDTDSYTVTFDFDYLGTVETQVVEDGLMLSSPTLPNRLGYQSEGWWIQEDGKWQQWDFETDIVCADITLVHRWLPENYTVYLNLNDGSGSQLEIPVTCGERYELPEPERDGYVFEGWYRGSELIPDQATYRNQGNLYLNAVWSPYGAGTTVSFGRYEQDGNTENGSEPILWLIAERNEENNTYFLISKHVIEWLPYHNDKSQKTYANCWLRAWLNNDFYQQAFDHTEQAYIAKTPLKDVSVSDHIFLPSEDECTTYLRQATYAAGVATPYVKKIAGESPDLLENRPSYKYMLRASSRVDWTNIVTVGIGIGAMSVYDKPQGVRPAMWVDAAYVDGLLAQQ
jgi:uncharacterized repeat protein (TIGR02543 family)